VKKTKTTRLGRGLGALITEQPAASNDNESAGKRALNEIEVAKIKANPFQPRLEFSEEALSDLKKSIKEKGIIQPIAVREVDDHYELISGERRLRAVLDLGYEKIPAFVIDVTTKEEMLELAIIENVQREKLNPIEEALAYQRLIDECNLTQDEVAQKIGKDRSTITNIIRLLKLPDEIKDSLKDGGISMGHARALLSVDDTSAQKYLWKKILKNNLSVRKVEALIKDLGEKKSSKTKESPKRSIFVQKAEENLREIFGTKVNIRMKNEGGAIEIEFYSPEDLNRLLEIVETVNS
jgi:ParB family chromosome partitioning protein